MILIEHPVEFQGTYDLTRIGSLKELLFFDIETTGFSGDTSNLYLIGCTYYRDGGWNMIQWFVDTRDSEPQVLEAFFRFLRDFKILVHFNGDGFDIPYLLKRCARLGVSGSFDGVASLDIYKKARPLKRLLGLDSLKQKAIEQFLGVTRTDVFSGGELIEVYREYLRSGDQRLLRLLILHNEDDLKGMPSILPILNYTDFLDGPLTLGGQSRTEIRDVFGQSVPMLELEYQSPFCLPVEFQAENGRVCLNAADRTLTCRVELYEGELKFFYPNFKDYYYLPFEDAAVHKSVGEYVDKNARVKATAKTCYTRKCGLFLPQFEELWTPVLLRDYKDKTAFAEYCPEMFASEEAAPDYARQLLRYVQSGKG